MRVQPSILRTVPARRPGYAFFGRGHLLDALEMRILLAATVPHLAVFYGSTPVTSEFSCSFGTVIQGSSGVSRTFTVRNTAVGPARKGHKIRGTLTFGELVVPDGYTVVGGLPSTLAPGATGTFSVRLDTATVGVRNGQISFVNNDPKQTPFAFSVTGRVIARPAPRVVVRAPSGLVVSAASTISFGGIMQGAGAATKTFTVTNTGNAALVLGPVRVPAGYTLTRALPASLAPGVSAAFSVRLDDAVVGVKGGSISFHTNVVGRDPFGFAVNGRVTGVVARLDSDGTLSVTGTGGPDVVTFSGGPLLVRVFSRGQLIGAFAGVERIVASGGGGDDLIDVGNLAIPSQLDGGAGDDTLYGGAANDTIHGGDGNDVIAGGYGVDCLWGDGGDDWVNGIDGTPDTIIDGGSGSNLIRRDPTDPR